MTDDEKRAKNREKQQRWREKNLGKTRHAKQFVFDHDTLLALNRICRHEDVSANAFVERWIKMRDTVYRNHLKGKALEAYMSTEDW